jgi:hypothetical protein
VNHLQDLTHFFRESVFVANRRSKNGADRIEGTTPIDGQNGLSFAGENTHQSIWSLNAEKPAPRRFHRGQFAGIRSHPCADSRHFANCRYTATR